MVKIIFFWEVFRVLNVYSEDLVLLWCFITLQSAHIPTFDSLYFSPFETPISQHTWPLELKDQGTQATISYEKLISSLTSFQQSVYYWTFLIIDFEYDGWCLQYLDYEPDEVDPLDLYLPLDYHLFLISFKLFHIMPSVMLTSLHFMTNFIQKLVTFWQAFRRASSDGEFCQANQNF